MTEVRRTNASELWDTMRRTRFCFALIDPVTHRIVDANDRYAALFELDVAELKGRTVMSLYPPEISSSVEVINNTFAQGMQNLVHGQMALQKPSGETIKIAGWSRRFEGMSERPLVVSCIVEVGVDPLPDDRHWVARAPHVFGLPDGGSESGQDSAQRADELEHLLGRIAKEVRASGLMPVAGGRFPQGPIKELAALTDRQREVVERLVAGDRVIQIAREMYLSPSTIRNHLTAVYRKFGVHSQVGLISVLKDLVGEGAGAQ